MTRDLDELRELTRLLEERALQEHRVQRAEEARLRAEIGQIDAMRSAAQGDPSVIDTRQVLGADLLWKGWLAGRRERINQELALSRARQDYTLARARQEFSRHGAVEELMRRDEARRRIGAERRRQIELDALLSLRRDIEE